jgi:uncharacterized membrane protein YqgA involved in biofilm formation
MLPKIILTLLQLHVAIAYGPSLRGLIPANLGVLNIFLLAVIVAVVVWIAGHIGALVLKETPPPTNATLAWCLVLAAVFAGLSLVPQVTSMLNATARQSIPPAVYPAIGAVLGYLIKR